MAKQQQTKSTETVLEKDGKTRTVTSADDVVRFKFNGWKVKEAGKEAPAVSQTSVTTTDKK